MPTFTATPAALAELLKAKAAAEYELKKMRQINSAFRAGRHGFLRRGYSAADFQKFADTIMRNPDYGPVPFSLRLVLAKVAQIDRLGKAIIIGQRFLTPAIAG